MICLARAVNLGRPSSYDLLRETKCKLVTPDGARTLKLDAFIMEINNITYFRNEPTFRQSWPHGTGNGGGGG
jgi:hypothetical protein